MHYARDIEKTAEFYLGLGFFKSEQNADHLSVRLNWFWMDFEKIDTEDKPGFKEEAQLPNKGAGIYIYLSVDNVDEFYDEIVKKGYKPSTKPVDQPWGNREFILRDPDGYKLVFFKKLK